VEVVHDSESVEPKNDKQTGGSETTVTGDEGVPAGFALPLHADDIPVEPSPDSEDEAGTKEADPARIHETLLRFHLYGHRPKEAPASSDTHMPAMLYPYRNLQHARHEYPVYVNGDDPEHAFRSLSVLTDEVLFSMTEEGDEREYLRRDLYRVERLIKTSAALAPDTDFELLWDEAVTSLLDSDQIDEDRKSAFRDSVARARREFPMGGRLMGCTPETAEQLFADIARLHWRDTSKTWAGELDTLIARLQNILGADDNLSDEARSPDHLRESVADDMDFEAMATIIGGSAQGERLPDGRRKRIADALAALADVRPVFGGGKKAEDASVAPFETTTPVTTCTRALEEHQKRMGSMVEFFRAVRIARLEIENRYRENVHDEYFSSFDASHLTEEEFSLYPPILLRLTPESLTNSEAGALLDMLGSGVPVKALVEIDDLTGEANLAGPSVAVWPRRIANAAMALGDVFVTQVPLSRVSDLRARCTDGFAYGGPALFVVYTGNTTTHDRLTTYLVAEAAGESRMFPGFTFDPGRGDTAAERMDASVNSRLEADWPVEPMQYRNADGGDAMIDLSFTPADYLACDRRFDDHFWRLDRAQWHEEMLPLSTYVERDLTDDDSIIPYILTVDKNGRIGRTVVTRAVLATTLHARSLWRSLQENSGINNSFALRLVDEEKEKLLEEKQRDVEAIEKNYSAQLDQDIGDLTKEIVKGIVNRLLTEGGTPAPARMAPLADAAAPAAPVAPADTDAPATEVAPAVEEEAEEEIGSFDDPYIDTPLCTSCNECTQLNAQLFAYNPNKQAYIKDAAAGPFQDLVKAAELCPVRIIHPGKPKNSDEAGLDDWIERAAPFN